MKATTEYKRYNQREDHENSNQDACDPNDRYYQDLEHPDHG